jgi:hypothetical protein
VRSIVHAILKLSHRFILREALLVAKICRHPILFLLDLGSICTLSTLTSPTTVWHLVRRRLLWPRLMPPTTFCRPQRSFAFLLPPSFLPLLVPAVANPALSAGVIYGRSARSAPLRVPTCPNIHRQHACTHAEDATFALEQPNNSQVCHTPIYSGESSAKTISMLCSGKIELLNFKPSESRVVSLGHVFEESRPICST